MALIKPFKDEGTADDVLSVAKENFDNALKAVGAMISQAEREETAQPQDIKQLARDFRAAAQTLFDERKRLETLRKRDVGIVYDYALDLEAARAEIGSLLDRLRADHGSKGVSG